MLKKMGVTTFLAAVVATSLLSGCSAPKATNYKVGVVGFQQCRPDLVLKEIGYNDIQVRNDANRCSRLGMPVIFAAELAKVIGQRLNKSVAIVPLDVPYNYNIRSQIDLAKSEKIDFLVGGKLDMYLDPSAVARAKKSGILPDTATLSPTPSSIRDDAKTVLKADLKLARVADGAILAEYQADEEGDQGGDVFTRDLAERIADKIDDSR